MNEAVAKKLNMTLNPVGGKDAYGAFIDFAQRLVRRLEGVQKKFEADTGVCLGQLLNAEHGEAIDRSVVNEVIPVYFDWVATKYWGVECEVFEMGQVYEVCHLIHSVDLPDSVFFKNGVDEVGSFVNGQSLVCLRGGKIIGVVLVMDGYIDTLVSSVKGIGSNLLQGLKCGSYRIKVHESNVSGKRLLEKFCFKHDGCGVMSGDIEGV